MASSYWDPSSVSTLLYPSSAIVGLAAVAVASEDTVVSLVAAASGFDHLKV